MRRDMTLLRRTIRSAGVAAALTLLAAASAGAQDSGDAFRGAEFAARSCRGCHGVQKDEASGNSSAPPFSVIANVEGMTAAALTVTLRTSHRSMPNIILTPDESADVIAYILTLRSR